MFCLHQDMLEASDSPKFPELYQQLLQLVSYATKPPKFGKVEAKSVANARSGQVVTSKVHVLRLSHVLYVHVACS